MENPYQAKRPHSPFATAHLLQRTNFLSEVPRLDNELGGEDWCLSQETNLLLEGVRFGAKSKLTRKGVYWTYIPFRGNELGAEDDPLSQQIIYSK